MGSQNTTNEDVQLGNISQPDFQVISSIRSDVHLRRCSKNTAFSGFFRQEPTQFYMLELHHDRILEALHELGWTEAYRALADEKGLVDLQQALTSHLFSHHGDAGYPAPLKVTGSLGR